ncbi:GGDEF domain-containing protein [Actinomycetospora sp. NBRC 106378]|uniref:GGDEF domain-containing protein n=1 Tax=Actinomycetospora sp. NBRC 106378 TaxID=3032208 RepID=UPI0024A0A47E|nr:GGDEF domain-containing protein [Actinomycetospora sp. NBRC 106378]GLZ53940.1 GGDEF domain-containing protein [Actinomycetospora sp. NBRC 106378]
MSTTLEDVAAELAPPRAFDAACRMVLDYLAETVPMGVWAVSRVIGRRQTMLVTADRAYGIRPGAEVAWSTSLCRTMSLGTTPRVVADTALVPDLAEAVDAQARDAVRVGAYVGTPILQPDGSLFGTVVGLNPDPLPETFLEHETLLDLLSSLLSSVLEADSAAVETARALERAVSDAETDALTGLLNRRGWQRWLDREEDRFRRFGDPAAVVMFDLDGLKTVNDTEGHDAGDRYLHHTARALLGAVRAGDPLARLGGDEFGLVASVGADDAARLADRLQAALADADVPCSVGVAPFRVDGGFAQALAEADAAMYENKRARRSARATQSTHAGVAGVREPVVEVTPAT